MMYIQIIALIIIGFKVYAIVGSMCSDYQTHSVDPHFFVCDVFSTYWKRSFPTLHYGFPTCTRLFHLFKPMSLAIASCMGVPCIYNAKMWHLIGKVLLLNLTILRNCNMHSTTPRTSYKTIPPLRTAMGLERRQNYWIEHGCSTHLMGPCAIFYSWTIGPWKHSISFCQTTHQKIGPNSLKSPRWCSFRDCAR